MSPLNLFHRGSVSLSYVELGLETLFHVLSKGPVHRTIQEGRGPEPEFK